MITMRDIAVRAGVSRSTVSLVLNKKHTLVGISEDTRRRILRTAEEMGYRRNELARAVVTGKNPVFGFLVPTPEAEVAARLLAGALEEAEARRHTVQVIRLPGGDDHSSIERCVELRPVGVMAIYVPQSSLDHLHTEMMRYRIPIAVLDSSFPQEQGYRILSDDIDGCRQAIAHLTGLGHRRIAYIGGPASSGATAVREEGYRLAMAQHDLPVPESYVVYGDWAPAQIDRATRALFSGESGAELPTALFCADDKTAMAASRTLRQMGFQTPGDISVVGFADLTMASFADPPLTTIAQPFHQMGRVAVSCLFAASQADRDAIPAYSEERLPTHLIVRESTARIA